MSSLSPWDTALPGASVLTVAEDMRPGGRVSGGPGNAPAESHIVYLNSQHIGQSESDPTTGEQRGAGGSPPEGGGAHKGGGSEYSETSSNDYHVCGYLRTPG